MYKGRGMSGQPALSVSDVFLQQVVRSLVSCLHSTATNRCVLASEMLYSVRKYIYTPVSTALNGLGVPPETFLGIIFTVAPCILKIRLLSHTNKRINYIIYYLKPILNNK
jgi:hypothetical protein